MKPARILGHHVHPMLIVFPLGLLAISVVFDVAYLMRGDAGLAMVSYWNIAAGVIGGLIAAVFGTWDWLTISPGTRAKRIGLWHGLTNVVVVALFASSWFIRRGDPSLVPNGAALALSFVALGLALISGWLGGELVERLGVGVDPQADANAPSSLGTKRPRSSAYGGAVRG